MDISWEDARLFLAVAEAGTLSAAARQLGVGQPTVSRRLAELEAELGEPLFTRSTDGVRPTAFGQTLLEPAQRMAEWAAELSRVADKRGEPLEGAVTITAPPGVASDFLVPFAAWLRSAHEGLRLDVRSSVRYLDLARREADLALRLQRPDAKDLVVLESITIVGAPCAAPALAERLGENPKLHDVDWIAWAPPFEETLPNPLLEKLIPGFRPAFASDDFLVQLRAAELGLGAMFLPRSRHRFSRDTALVELHIEDVPPAITMLHLVAAKGSLGIPRIRLVADLLATELRAFQS